MLLFSASELAVSEHPSWVSDALEGFVRSVQAPGFPCTFAVSALRADLLVFAVVPDVEGAAATLALVLERYLLKLRDLPAKRAGLAGLVVLIQAPTELTLEDSHRRAWGLLEAARDHGGAAGSRTEATGEDPHVFVFGGQRWFVNVSSASHVHRRSRNLGAPLVLAMQPLDASNGLFASAKDKRSSQQIIRAKVTSFDGMPANVGLGSLDEGVPARPLSASYCLPDTNDDSAPQPWKLNK